VAQARRSWQTEADGVGGISPERLVFLDECGVLTTMACLSGRSPRGTRACASAPFGHWMRLSVLGALGAEGIVGAMSVQAATSAAVFHAYLDQVLLPELRRSRPDAVLAMDNLPAHKAPRIRALLDRSGFAFRYLPAYSPDLNPIEPAWAKVKAELRRVAARTADALHEALGPLWRTAIIRAWDRNHRGLVPTPIARDGRLGGGSAVEGPASKRPLSCPGRSRSRVRALTPRCWP
jgi:transposase